MKKIIVLLFLICNGCSTMSQKAPDPFGADLHHALDFLEPRTVLVVYPAGEERDSLGQIVHPDDPALLN